MADIFLSYAREDRPWADRLAAGLIEHGWSLFWDSHIPVGKSFDQVIENQLDTARCIVVLWSRHSISSNWVKAEASEGARRGILHPVLIENVRLPLEFRRLQTANLIDWQRGTSHGEFDQLVGGIAATLGSQKGLYERLQEARAAHERGDGARCLEILREIADAAEAAGLGDEAAELRRTAEAEQDEACQAELLRQRARAEEQRAAAGASRSRAQADGATLREAVERQRSAHERMSQAHESAQSTDACSRATALRRALAPPREGPPWSAAEASVPAAEMACEREPYGGATEGLEGGPDLFQQSGQATPDTDWAEGDDAVSPRAMWADAEVQSIDGESTLQGGDDVGAEGMFEQESVLHRRVEGAVQEDLPREELGREPDAPRREAESWQGAESTAAADESPRQLDAAEPAREWLAQIRAAAAPTAPGEPPASLDPAVDGALPFARGADVEVPAPEGAEMSAVEEAEGGELAPLPALPMEPQRPRPPWRLGGARLVACAGCVGVVLSALGISWYRSAQEETAGIQEVRSSPAPQPPKSAPSQTNSSGQPPEPSLATDREREVVRNLSTQTAAAPEQATQASAERVAGALFTTAAGRQGDAESGRLQTPLDVSREGAAGAQAEKSATPQLTKAISLDQAAQAAVAQREHDKTGELPREATATLGGTAKAAAAESARLAKVKEGEGKGEPARDLLVGPAGARADAEGAKVRMAATKRAAEQVAAGFYAHQRFTSAQSKERDGIAALGQSDYRLAIRLLVEAQSEYQAAAQEARREAETDRQLAPAKASLKQAQTVAEAQRQQALAAQADDLARDVFDKAQTRQVEADGLTTRQDLAAAARAYQDAAERYGEATRRARAARAAP